MMLLEEEIKDLLALYLNGTYGHKIGIGPPSCQVLENRLFRSAHVKCLYAYNYRHKKEDLWFGPAFKNVAGG